MRLERRHAWLLLGVAVWNLLTYAMFTRNLWAAYAEGEDRPTGYWVAHTVLIVVNVAIGLVLGRLGLRALRHADEQRTSTVGG
ncbi:SCO4848 family membrane protein [Nocardioides sp. SYSU DS0663]|uniref:SCO4848 family membrane protein n=1 Tax=Nocardioides sp. SYSU DS0663 TaxID=3416445 RepID=UPI003F4B52FE